MTTQKYNHEFSNLPDERELENYISNFFPQYAPEAANVKESAGGGAAYKPIVVGKDESFVKGDSRIIKDAGKGKDLYVGNLALQKIRADFPILSQKVHGLPLVWFDNAATTQRPKQVIERIKYYYENENSNVHRGAHDLAARSTDAYEAAREKIANFIGAPSKDNIIFVRGTTEGINLIAQSFVRPLLNPGDEIILTNFEHHANIVPGRS